MRHLLKLMIVSSLLLTIGCSSGDDDDDGGSDGGLSTNACGDIGLSTRIVNGTSCGNLSNSPVVRVVLFDATGRNAFCSGTMVTNNDVLTAAHCFIVDPVRVSVIFGDSLASSTTVDAESWNVHSGFTGTGSILFNDAAIIHLSKDVNLPKLPVLVRVAPQVGQVASIFGYGQDENGDFDFGDLQSGQMRLSEVLATHIQADFDGDGSNTCLGDSGGPLVLTVEGRPTLIGITSTGTVDDCSPGDNSFFTNLQDPDVQDFLRNQVPDAEYF